MREAKRVALTAGIVWGACVFLTTLLSVYTGYGSDFLKLVASIYPGFNVSVGGSFVGLIYGFLDAFVGVYIVFWVYSKVK